LLSLYSDFDVDETLTKVNVKFGKRMYAIKQLMPESGLPHLQGQSMELMLTLWRKTNG
jgi:hypothetical protein